MFLHSCSSSPGVVNAQSPENLTRSLNARAKVEATQAINECLSGLYSEGLFLKAERAEFLARRGLKFLEKYSQLALMCFRVGKRRFPLIPKGHYCHHQFLDLLRESRKGQWCLNTLAYSNQMAEDFVGKSSRVSRRVSPRTTSLRVIQRLFLLMRDANSSLYAGGKVEI